MQLIIQKFGGTSVGNIERIKNVAKIIINEIKQGNKVVVVVSAMAGVTNSLISLAQQLLDLNNITNLQEYDTILSTGETVAAASLSLELQRLNIKARSMQGWQIPIKTNDSFAESLVTDIDKHVLNELVKNNTVPVITGFQGVTKNGYVTTLGKGGSDISAALIAAKLQADRLDIYTDVTGVFTADPRIIHNTSKLDTISQEEMLALSSSGAKLLHERAALAILRYRLNVQILSSFDNISGTTITTAKKTVNKQGKKMENKLVTAITSDKNILKIDIDCQDNSSKIYQYLAKEQLPLEQIKSDGNKLTIMSHLNQKHKFITSLEELKKQTIIRNYTVNTNIATVTLVGYGIKSDRSLCWKLIDILSKIEVTALTIDISEIKATILVNDTDNEKVIKTLHDYFIPIP
ncbi:MAG: aspartate kinase [Rickettsiaceae bacterium]|nr:aspartate kinase [Rickettsiaceae bacterium]